MPNIVHRVGMENVTPEDVYRAVSTREGFASWWTLKTQGQARIEEILTFRFSDDTGGSVFEVLELTPAKRAAFKCIGGPEEWIDTHLEFDIRAENDETILLFKHSGWRQEVEFMHHCSTQWSYFLLGLKALLEGGEGHPYGGNFQPISSWSK